MSHDERGRLKEFAEARKQLNGVLKPLEDVEHATLKLRMLWGKNMGMMPERRDNRSLEELTLEILAKADVLRQAVEAQTYVAPKAAENSPVDTTGHEAIIEVGTSNNESVNNEHRSEP